MSLARELLDLVRDWEISEPASVVKSFASKTGKSVADVESMWNTAKSKVKDEYGYSEDDGDRFYQAVTGILKKMLKIN